MPLVLTDRTTSVEHVLVAPVEEPWVTAERRGIEEAKAFKRALLLALGLRGPERLSPDALRRAVQFGAVVEAAARRRAA